MNGLFGLAGCVTLKPAFSYPGFLWRQRSKVPKEAQYLHTSCRARLITSYPGVKCQSAMCNSLTEGSESVYWRQKTDSKQ